MQIPIEKELEIVKIVNAAKGSTKDEVVDLLHSVLVMFFKTEAAYKEIIGQQLLSGMYKQDGIKEPNL